MVFCLPHRLSLELSPTTRQNSRPESCTGSGQFPAQGLVSAVLLAEKALPPHPSYHTGLISLSLIETSPHSSPLSQPPSLLSLFALVFFLLFANTFCETLSSTQGMNKSTTDESVIHSFNRSIPSFLPWKSMYLPDPEDKKATMVRSLPSQTELTFQFYSRLGSTQPHTHTCSCDAMWKRVRQKRICMPESHKNDLNWVGWWMTLCPFISFIQVEKNLKRVR